MWGQMDNKWKSYFLPLCVGRFWMPINPACTCTAVCNPWFLQITVGRDLSMLESWSLPDLKHACHRECSIEILNVHKNMWTKLVHACAWHTTVQHVHVLCRLVIKYGTTWKSYPTFEQPAGYMPCTYTMLKMQWRSITIMPSTALITHWYNAKDFDCTQVDCTPHTFETHAKDRWRICITQIKCTMAQQLQ